MSTAGGQAHEVAQHSSCLDHTTLPECTPTRYA